MPPDLRGFVRPCDRTLTCLRFATALLAASLLAGAATSCARPAAAPPSDARGAGKGKSGGAARTAKLVCDGAPCDVTVELNGNRRVPGARLFAGMRVLAEPDFELDTLERDVLELQAFYYDQGFLEVDVARPEVSWSGDRRAVHIQIAITEGARYRVRRIEAFEDRAGLRCPPAGGWSTRLGQGDVFNRGELIADLRRLEHAYRDQGYADVSATPDLVLDRERREVDVRIAVARGPVQFFGEVRITGNERVSLAELRDRVEIEPGARFSETAIDRTKERLMETGLFERVDLSIGKKRDPAIVDLDIEVTERSEDSNSASRSPDGGRSRRLAPAPERLLSPAKALEDASAKAFDDADTRGCQPIPAPAEVGIRHILVQYAGCEQQSQGVTRSRGEARRLAAEILQRLRDGASFEEMVKEHTDEPGGVARGGDLGVFGPREMVENFSDAAFALHVGEISQVVETKYGFHILLRTQ
jgi:hypothetical protein